MQETRCPESGTRMLPPLDVESEAASPMTTAPPSREVVLAVVRPDRWSSVWAVRRARALAHERSADLRFVCVVPEPELRGRLREDERAVARALERVRRRAVEVLKAYGGTDQGALSVRVGHATDVACAAARELGASLLVTGEEPGSGGVWARVARRSGIPVVVARPGGKRGEILAATDFSDERFPTFNRATRLAAKANGRVVLLHNVDPDGSVFTRGGGFVLSQKAIRQLRDARARKLHDLAYGSEVDAYGVLTGNDEPVSAIVEHARRRDADLVVLGAHAPSPTRRGPRDRTASKVIERLARTALVVPLA